MSSEGHSDQEYLLRHAASIKRDVSRIDSSKDGFDYELEDFHVGDIGLHKRAIGEDSPPAYSSRWDDVDFDTDRNVKGLNEDSSPTLNRSSTFGSFSPAVSDKFIRFLRYVQRSGRDRSHIPYDFANSDQAYKRQRFKGWRGGCLAAAISAGLVFLINFIFTVWAAVTSKSGTQIGTIYTGDCGVVKHADLWLHIAINLMGTMLLGASNYSMQCLTSPTRKEIDVAHAKGMSLDIGIPSPKNLNGPIKKTLFGLLIISTIPLHFLWNSAVFTTTQRLDYNVFVATPNFLTSTTVDCSQNVSYFISSADTGPVAYTQTPMFSPEVRTNSTFRGFNYSSVNPGSKGNWFQADVCDNLQALRRNLTQGTLISMNNSECIHTYGIGNSRMSNWGSVLVVTKNQPATINDTILMQFRYEMYVSNYTGNNWVCNPNYLLANDYQCDRKSLAASADSWAMGVVQADRTNPWAITSVDEWPIDYCLAQETGLGGQCQLQYSLVIMIIVMIANITKLICIVLLLRTHFDPILTTVGDGIATFLERPDKFTVDMPFLTRKEARSYSDQKVITRQKTPQPWKKPKQALRWWHTPSRPRWAITLILCSVAIAATAGLLATGNQTVMDQGSYASPYTLGFGAYNQYAVLSLSLGSGDAEFTSTSILMGMVVIANLPQVIVSCLYFTYNTVYTSMLSGDEWSRFTYQRKALRTTDRRGEQRSTYWLSLPWTYAFPLAIASSVLHWMISQSLFVARTEILDTYGAPESISYMEIGYSPIAILTSLLFGTAMVMGMVLNGYRRLRPCILVGNNSLAIAAACHRPAEEVKGHLKKVRWGAILHERNGMPGHCCFTSGEVEEPREGDLYR